MAPGKLVRGALYAHRDAVRELAASQQERVERAVTAAPEVRWNVARIERTVVGLLEYEDFDAAAFPCLLAATRVDLESGSVRRTDFSRTANPLILHRKELLVPKGDERAASWRQTTQRLVELGLFENSHLIGRRDAWLERLAVAGIVVSGNEVTGL